VLDQREQELAVCGAGPGADGLRDEEMGINGNDKIVLYG
jgi:hypothetical protein